MDKCFAGKERVVDLCLPTGRPRKPAKRRESGRKWRSCLVVVEGGRENGKSGSGEILFLGLGLK